MIRNLQQYQLSLFDQTTDPIFHWSQIIKGIPGLSAIDIDCCIRYLDWRLFLEYKISGGSFTPAHIDVLTDLSRQPRSDAIVIWGTLHLDGTSGVHSMAWVRDHNDWWIQHSKRRATVFDVRRAIIDWKEAVDVMQNAANDPVFSRQAGQRAEI
jgi:hypothetical protein